MWRSYWIKKYNLIYQPNYLYVDRDSTQKQVVDYSLSKLIECYEKEKGVIVLEDCDLKTPLDSIYNCKGVPKANRTYFREEIMIKKRDELVAETVRNSPKTKLLLIYGAAHYEGIRKNLENTDR